MSEFKERSRDSLLPSRMTVCPRIKHASGRNQVRPPGGFPLLQGRDRWPLPQPMHMDQVGPITPQFSPHRRRQPEATRPEGGMDTEGQGIPKGDICLRKLIPERKHPRRNPLGGEGLVQAAHAVKQAPSIARNRRGQDCQPHKSTVVNGADTEAQAAACPRAQAAPARPPLPYPPPP